MGQPDDEGEVRTIPDHHFNPVLAQTYGVDAAVFLHNIYFWLKHNKAYEKKLPDINPASSLTDNPPKAPPGGVWQARLMDGGLAYAMVEEDGSITIEEQEVVC